jgi:hypothetical protein
MPSGWVVGGFVLIALLLVTFVCYQVYYKWTWTENFQLANMLPEFLRGDDGENSDEDTFEKDDDDEEESEEAENTKKDSSISSCESGTKPGATPSVKLSTSTLNAVRVVRAARYVAPQTPLLVPSSRPLVPLSTSSKTAGTKTGLNTSVASADTHLLAFMQQEAKRSERLLQKLDKLVRNTTQLLCNDDEGQPFDLDAKGHKLGKPVRSISQQVSNSIDTRLGKALDTQLKKMVPPTFVKTHQPHSMYITGANYNPTTELLSVPVNRRNCHTFELVEGSMPRILYTVNDACNAFSILVATTASTDPADYAEYSGVLANGDYSLSTLATHLQTQMRAATDSGATALSVGLTAGTFDVSVNTTTHKFTFSTGTDYFVIKFADPDLGYMLGFGLHNTFPTTTTVTSTLPAGTYTVVDTNLAVSDVIAAPATVLHYPTLTVGGTAAIYTQVSYAPTQSLVSTGRADLFGCRYVVLQCDELKTRYGDDSTVARITQVNEMNHVDWKQGHSYERRFMQPASLRTLTMKLKVSMPSGKLVTADTSLLSFDLHFVALFDNVKMNREMHMPGGKYNMNTTATTVV